MLERNSVPLKIQRNQYWGSVVTLLSLFSTNVHTYIRKSRNAWPGIKPPIPIREAKGYNALARYCVNVATFSIRLAFDREINWRQWLSIKFIFQQFNGWLGLLWFYLGRALLNILMKLVCCLQFQRTQRKIKWSVNLTLALFVGDLLDNF